MFMVQPALNPSYEAMFREHPGFASLFNVHHHQIFTHWSEFWQRLLHAVVIVSSADNLHLECLFSSQRRYIRVGAAAALWQPTQPPRLVGQSQPRRRRSFSVHHRPNLLPRPVLGGSVPSSAPHRDLSEPTDLRAGVVCAALQPMAERWWSTETPVTVYNGHSTLMEYRFSDDPVYMPLDVQRDEYIKSDYGLVYMGSQQNISRRPWLYGQVCR